MKDMDLWYGVFRISIRRPTASKYLEAVGNRYEGKQERRNSLRSFSCRDSDTSAMYPQRTLTMSRYLVARIKLACFVQASSCKSFVLPRIEPASTITEPTTGDYPMCRVI